MNIKIYVTLLPNHELYLVVCVGDKNHISLIKQNLYNQIHTYKNTFNIFKMHNILALNIRR